MPSLTPASETPITNTPCVGSAPVVRASAWAARGETARASERSRVSRSNVRPKYLVGVGPARSGGLEKRVENRLDQGCQSRGQRAVRGRLGAQLEQVGL